MVDDPKKRSPYDPIDLGLLMAEIHALKQETKDLRGELHVTANRTQAGALEQKAAMASFQKAIAHLGELKEGLEVAVAEAKEATRIVKQYDDRLDHVETKVREHSWFKGTLIALGLALAGTFIGGVVMVIRNDEKLQVVTSTANESKERLRVTREQVIQIEEHARSIDRSVTTFVQSQGEANRTMQEEIRELRIQRRR